MNNYNQKLKLKEENKTDNDNKIITSINQLLDWTPEEKKDLWDRKKNKANKLLREFISQGNEESAQVLMLDKTLEVNADINNKNYEPFQNAIKNGCLKLVKEIFLNPQINYSLKIESMDIQKTFKNIALSNSPQMYDFIENLIEDKKEMLSVTINVALIEGKLNLIKHLIDKKVEDQYIEISPSAAIRGYLFEPNFNFSKDSLEYIAFFADMDNKIKNTSVDFKFKQTFFNAKILSSLKYRKEEESLKYYKKYIDEKQIIEDVAIILRDNDFDIKENNEKLINDMKWLFLNCIGIDFKQHPLIPYVLNKNTGLNDFYDKLQLTHKLNNNLPEKHSSAKKLKI